MNKNNINYKKIIIEKVKKNKEKKEKKYLEINGT